LCPTACLGVAVVERLTLRDGRLGADASDAADPGGEKRHVGRDRVHVPEHSVDKAELSARDGGCALQESHPCQAFM